VPYLIGRNEYGKLRNLVKLGYFGGGALTFVFAVILFFASPFIADFVKQPMITPILQMMSIWLVIKEIDDVSRGTLTGLKKIREARSLEVLQNFAKLAITLIAIYMIGATIDALTWGFLLSFVIILPIGIYYVLSEMKNWKGQEKEMSVGEQFGLGKEVVFFGIVITMINSMWVVIQYTDRIMISYFMDESVALESIAVYSIALGLANLILIFSAAIGGIFFPVVSELYGKKDEMADIHSHPLRADNDSIR
jgi:O-antigen/teichoic acid export membrane protein